MNAIYRNPQELLPRHVYKVCWTSIDKHTSKTVYFHIEYTIMNTGGY